MTVRSKSKKHVKSGRPEVFNQQSGAKEPYKYSVVYELCVSDQVEAGGDFIVASQNIVRCAGNEFDRELGRVFCYKFGYNGVADVFCIYIGCFSVL